jgi:hypothetical protein
MKLTGPACTEALNEAEEAGRRERAEDNAGGVRVELRVRPMPCGRSDTELKVCLCLSLFDGLMPSIALNRAILGPVDKQIARFSGLNFEIQGDPL